MNEEQEKARVRGIKKREREAFARAVWKIRDARYDGPDEILCDAADDLLDPDSTHYIDPDSTSHGDDMASLAAFWGLYN